MKKNILYTLLLFSIFTLSSQWLMGQQVYGPESSSFATYNVDTNNVDIKYHWHITGGYIIDSIGTYHDTVLVRWTDTNRKLEVREEPIFLNNTLDVTNLGATGNDVTVDDIAFQKAIDSLFVLGGGTVLVPAGTFYIKRLVLRTGIRIMGIDSNNSILKRPSSETTKAFLKMMTVYSASSSANVNYAFLPISDKNSRPIEICHLQLDANQANGNTDSLEHSSLIFLEAPDDIVPDTNQTITVNGTPIVYPNALIMGSGKLKVFIHDIAFKNSMADAVDQYRNVDLHYHNSSGENIYRGTYTLTGGNTIARIKLVNSYGADTFQKGIDFEKNLGGANGYNNNGFRVWVDSCTFLKKGQFDYDNSNLYLTNTKVLEGPTMFQGIMGDLVCKNSILNFTNNSNNYALGPQCGRFEQSTFRVTNTGGCYRGLNFRNTIDTVTIHHNLLGFNQCTFIADSASFVGVDTLSAIYVNKNLVDTTVQFYFDSCINIGYDSLLRGYTYNSNTACPSPDTSLDFLNPNVRLNDSVLVCGETEDEIKAHFGIRKITIDSAFKCNMGLMLDSTIHLWHNPKASELISLYANDTLSNKKLYIHGEMRIDTNITFNQCQLWFTPQSKIAYANNKQLNIINASQLAASCDYWEGIELLNATQKLSIDSSTIQDMALGINVKDNALLVARQSNFINNASGSIHFIRMNANPYLGSMTKNSFKSNAAFVPINGLAKPQYGIRIVNSTGIQLGDSSNTNLGNHFEKLYTGVYIHATSSIATTLPSNSNHIGLYNNMFKELSANYSTTNELISTIYLSPKGAGVYIDYGNVTAFNAHTTIRNTIPNTTVNANFINCDKAIVSKNNNLIAEKLYIKDNTCAIMNYTLLNKRIKININKIEGAFLGIQNIGVYDSSQILNNIINCTMHQNGIPLDTGLGAPYLWPKGIEISQYSNASNNELVIANNSITIPSYAGLGVSLDKPGIGILVKDNTVELSSTDASQLVCGGPTILVGILSQNAIGTRIHRNTINANTAGVYIPTNAAGRTDAAGILIDHGQNQAIGCNSINGARFGLMAWSENNTSTGDELKVQGNTVLDADAGWVFRHLATEGTLGQIGDAGHNNNNQFGNIGTNSKVFKFCLGLDFYQIFTTSINQLTESLSENMNTLQDDCPYQITPNPGATVFSIITDCGLLQVQPNDGSEIAISEAIAIATNTKVYVEFATLAHWYDSKRLFDYLSNHPNLLLDYPQLDSFYNTMSTNAIAQEQAADQQFKHLLQSFNLYTPAQQDSMLIYIENINNGINNSEEQNENERLINAIYIKLIRGDFDSLLQNEKLFIHDLANQCPYVGGSAVYKARTLNYYFSPGAMYDDMKACNAVGVYKQGSTSISTDKNNESLIAKEDKLLSLIKPTLIYKEQNDVMVYPNPTTEFCNIQYNSEEDALFKLYNIIGELIFTQQLFKGKTTQRISLSNIANGIYHYEVVFANKLKSIGKITKQN